LYLLLGCLSAAATAVLSRWMTTSAFNIPRESREMAVMAIRIAGLGLAVRFAYAVLEAIARGYQRYDMESLYGIFNTLATLLMAVVFAGMGKGLVWILSGAVVVIAIGAIGLAVQIAKLIRGWEWILPVTDWPVLKETLSFGVFSWVQGVSGLLLSQADRLLIASIIGPSALTYYVVCVQITQMAHGLLAKAGSFLFPYATSLSTKGDILALKRLFRRGMVVTTLLGCAMALGIIAFGEVVLRLWLGAEFAHNAREALVGLAAFNGFLATSIVPYHYMNGTGFVKLNTFIGLLSGVLVCSAVAFAVPAYGIVGAAWARLSNLAVSLVGRTILCRRVLRDRRWYAGLIQLVPPLAALMPITALTMTPVNELSILWRTLSLVSAGILGIGLCWVCCRSIYQESPKTH